MNEQTNEKCGFYNTVVAWACIIWAVASIGLIMYFSGLNQVTFAIMTVGQLFIIMGIILLDRKKLVGALSVFAGMSCVIIPAVSAMAEESARQVRHYMAQHLERA